MRDLTDAFLELIRRTATDLSPDVEKSLRDARQQEEDGSAAQGALDSILRNVEMARQNSTPICQDTGTPIFYVHHPPGWSTKELRSQIRAAVAQATEKAYLRPNAVDSISGVNSGDNLGDDAFPTLHFEEGEGDELIVDLMKGTIQMTPDELAETWDMIEKHIETEHEAINLAREAKQLLLDRQLPVPEYLVGYLLADEEKHNALLDQLRLIKDKMYPYA